MHDKEKRPQAVVGVLIVKDGKVLIGKRKETASHGQGEYSFPGGHIEFQESFISAIKRETLEEAGVEIKDIKFLCVANINMYNKVLVGVTAYWDKGEAATHKDENIGNWQWYDLDKLPEPLFYPTKVLIDAYKTGKNYYDKE
ncbi:MAG TPA: NUDIX domain-containing protein [Candidatus Paceibacterota bacterium]|nr:NUDIX domain-containing protein [Candidatus Paceibacterota bacterium]